MLLKHSNPNHFSLGLSYIVTPIILGSFKLNSRHIISIKILKFKLFKSQNPYTVPVCHVQQNLARYIYIL